MPHQECGGKPPQEPTPTWDPVGYESAHLWEQPVRGQGPRAVRVCTCWDLWEGGGGTCQVKAPRAARPHGMDAKADSYGVI